MSRGSRRERAAHAGPASRATDTVYVFQVRRFKIPQRRLKLAAKSRSRPRWQRAPCGLAGSRGAASRCRHVLPLQRRQRRCVPFRRFGSRPFRWTTQKRSSTRLPVAETLSSSGGSSSSGNERPWEPGWPRGAEGNIGPSALAEARRRWPLRAHAGVTTRHVAQRRSEWLAGGRP
ncbi:unnamed protein product [Lampetra planeri]